MARSRTHKQGRSRMDGKYFTLKNGEKLYYEDTGEGPETLIMMHGWTSSHEVYGKPAELLKGKARCIIYDHRGHGGSKDANREKPTMETMASDLNELITGLSLSDVTLLGWSMGACVAMNYVRLYGCSALKQLVLCDMTPKALNDEEWKLGLYQGAYTASDAEKEGQKTFFNMYKGFAIRAIPKLRRVPGFLLNKPLRETLAACDEPVLKSLSVSMTRQDNRDVIGMISVPLFYFYADPGSLFSPELAEWYGENVKAPYQAVMFPKSNHMFISEYPERFAEEVGKLL